MTAKDLKVGSVIAMSKDGVNWTETKITQQTDKFVWFKGTGYNRIARTTVDKYPTLFKIITI
jgi:hypothetical protein